MISVMTKDIEANRARLYQVGGLIGAPLWDGLLSKLSGSGIVNHIIAEVLAALAGEI